MSSNLLPLAIIATAFVILYTPFFIYAIRQWVHNKQHYIIKKRFPAISYALVILNIVTILHVTIVYWLRCYISLNYIALFSAEAMQMAVFGMINLRLFLIYLRWKTTFAIIHGLIQMKAAKSIWYHWFSITLILLAIICPLLTVFNIGKQIFWTIYIIITIVLICIIICKHVREGISVTKETMLELFVVLLTGLLPVLDWVIPILEWPVQIIFNLSPYAQCTIVLYFPLHQINKLEKIMMNPQMRLRTSSQFSNSTNKSSTNEDAPVSTTIDIRNVKKEGELFQFLKKHENYIVFRNYMTHSWALENLLFVEQTQILRNIVTKYAKKNEPNQRRVHQMRFKYLKDIYSEFKQRVDEELANQESNGHTDFDKIKHVLYQLHYQIYEQFIQGAEDMMINISFEARNCLSSLFDNKEYSDKFASFDDFIHVFDDSVFEIYRLLLSMYQFRFEQYIEHFMKE